MLCVKKSAHFTIYKADRATMWQETVDELCPTFKAETKTFVELLLQAPPL